MIVRTWHGRVANSKAPAQSQFVNGRAIPDHRAVPRSLSVHVLERPEGDLAHFITMTFWESLDAIKDFAGNDMEVARCCPED